MRKGVTLIELVVSMGIFTVIATVAVGAFVTVTRMKTMASDARETQQKVRIATERISRLSRLADYVILNPPANNSLELHFSTISGIKASKFSIEGTRLYYYDECTTRITNVYTPCESWPTSAEAEDLLGEVIELTAPLTNNFGKRYSYGKPELQIDIRGRAISPAVNNYTPNDIKINTSIILERLK